MTPTFTVAVLHRPDVAERVGCLSEMQVELGKRPDIPMSICMLRRAPEEDWHDFKVKLFEDIWGWSSHWSSTHHLFLTDDLYLAPGFWNIVEAMVNAKPDAVIGLLSNHPRGPELYAAGARGYRTDSWLVGPAYILPHAHLQSFYKWWLGLEDSHAELTGRRYWNDDNAINYWNTCGGGPGETWHPLPTPIEHRTDLRSTVGHGDVYSRERVSWRWRRNAAAKDGVILWENTPLENRPSIEEMSKPEFWEGEAEMLPVGG